MSLIAQFEEILNKIPFNRTAMIDADENSQVSYGDMWEQVCQLSSNLERIGICKGDRVILALPNSILWPVSYLALVKVGAVVVPIRPAGRTELKRVLQRVKPSMLLTDTSFVNRLLPLNLVEGDEAIAIAGSCLRRKSRIARICSLRALTISAQKTSSKQSHLYSPEENGKEALSINFTYRGLGRPLGAILTHNNYVAAIRSYIETVGLHEEQNILAALPFAHIYPLIGCLLAPLFSGGTVVLTRKISGEALLDTITKYRCGILTGVPTFYYQLTRSSANHSMAFVESAICGASLLSQHIFEAFRDKYGVEIRQGYGLTECFAVTCNPVTGNRPRSLGKLMVGADGLEIKIVDENAEQVAPRQIGEIMVRGPTVMSGYYGEPEVSKEVLQKDWFYTGDLGQLDEDGYLFFSGLKKRIAKVAGSMVDLCEVECEIRKICGALEIEVHPIADEKFGNVLCARIISQNFVAERNRIKDHLRRRIASYKIPVLWRNY